MSGALDTAGTIASPERSGEARSGGEARGSVPSPPPVPVGGNLDPKVLRDQLAVMKRRRRDVRREQWTGRVRGVNRQYWSYAAVVLGLAVGMLGCRSWQSQQRDTAMALASIAGARTAATEPAPVVVDGIENPLEQFPLTGQARWMIGADGAGVLPPLRSSIVIAALLEQLDLCNVWIGLNDRAGIVLSDKAAAQFYPLIECPATSSASTSSTSTTSTTAAKG